MGKRGWILLFVVCAVAATFWGIGQTMARGGYDGSADAAKLRLPRHTRPAADLEASRPSGRFRDWIYRWRHRHDPQPEPIPPDPDPIPPNPTPEPPGPQPPLPVPVPLPPNPPIPTTLIGVVVEESSQRTAAQAAVVLSPKTAALFKGGQFRVVDAWEDDGSRRDLGPGLKPYVDRIEVLKIKPALVIVAPEGGVYFEGPLPAKVADVESLVIRIRKGDRP